MTATALSCFQLGCDRCGSVYVDADSEGIIHKPSAEEIRDWAGSEGWVVSPSEDVCADCRIVAAAKPHRFRPRGDQFCVWCGEWADHELHVDAPIPGQLEIPTGGQS